VHNNNDIYTYIRSEGDNLSTLQISKQGIFSQVQITTKEVWKNSLAASQETGHDCFQIWHVDYAIKHMATNSDKQSGCIFTHSSLRQYRARYE